MHVRLDREFGEGQHHPRKDVDDNLYPSIRVSGQVNDAKDPRAYLLTDAPTVAAEDDIAAEQSRNECVIRPFFIPSRIQVFHGNHGAFVYNSECR